MSVKTVVAVWEDADGVVFFELRQADGTLRRQRAVCGGGESESREEFEKGRVETFGFSGGGRCGGGIREDVSILMVIAKAATTVVNDDDDE